MGEDPLRDVDLLSGAFLENPYEIYGMLRKSSPVAEAPFASNVWLITRFNDCSAVARAGDVWSSDDCNSSLWKQRPAARLRTPAEHHALRLEPFVKMDAPDHSRLRQFASSAFNARSVQRRRDHVNRTAAQLIDDARRAGGMDAISQFADLLPLMMVADTLGVPHSDLELLHRWSLDLGRSLDLDFGTVSPADRYRRLRAQSDFVDYLDVLVKEREKSPKEDLISVLDAQRRAGAPISYEEMMGIFILLLIAGHETTSGLIGNAILAFWRHPEQWTKLRDDPSLVRSAVEEVLRFDAPVQATARTSLRETTISGVSIPSGDIAILLLGAANRDPERFTDPDRFEITRADQAHMAFGAGVHYCIGAPLARLEGDAALQALIAATPYRVREETRRYKPNLVLRGLAELELEFC